MAYIKVDGANRKIDFNGASAGVTSLQAQDLGSNATITLPGSSGTLPLDAVVMHLAGTETASGAKTFSSLITASSGVNFGQDNLDHYDDGTFTPDMKFGGASTGITYTSRSGKYNRVGKKVTVEIEVILSSKGSSTGVATIGGLPYTNGSGYGGVNIGYYNNFASGVNILARIPASGTAVQLSKSGGTASVDLIDTDFTNTSHIVVTANYLMD